MGPRAARWLRWAAVPALLCAVGIALLTAWFAGLAADAPTVRELHATRLPQPSIVLSADGVELARFQLERHTPVTLQEVSPHVVQALIATEDHRFREHAGVDWRAVGRAAWRTARGRTEGGSTLTQQLARNLFSEEIGRARSIERKVKETVTALRIERVYTKDQILEAYLNTVPFLYNTVGIGAAAHTYFGKAARDLNVLESATLVGMLKGTRRFNPVTHPERAVARRNVVLQQMARRGHLPQADLDSLMATPLALDFHPASTTPQRAPHFTAHVRRTLDEWAELRDVAFERDGLTIHTTLDSGLQAIAEQAVTRQVDRLQQIAAAEWRHANSPQPARWPDQEGPGGLADGGDGFAHFWRTHPELLAEALRDTPTYQALRKAGRSAPEALGIAMRDAQLVQRVKANKTRLEAGLVAVEPTTGAVRAWVGSRDHEVDQFDHVAKAMRQPGSTFKPVVYAAALERGIPPSREYMDTAVDIQLGDGKVWRPTDMTGQSEVPLTLWEGLVYSRNAVTAQVMIDVGLDAIADLARAMGISGSPLDKVPSMALGTSPVTLLEMATVYATIANEGRHRKPYVVERITDRHGREMAVFGPQPSQQAISVSTHQQLIDMMRGVVRQGTGSLLRSRYVPELDVAGKSGTTQRNMDAWFLAMHPQLVTGVWLGFNDQRVTMRSRYWGQGGHSALRVVGDFLQHAHAQGAVRRNVAFAVPVRPPPNTSWDWARAMEEGDPSAVPGAGPASEAQTSPPTPFLRDDDDTPPMSEEELDHVMRSMGRDPDTGAPVGGGLMEPAIPP